MKLLLLLFMINFVGCSQDYVGAPEVKNINEYAFYKIENVGTDNLGYQLSRQENKEVVCYSVRTGIWCYKKDVKND